MAVHCNGLFLTDPALHSRERDTYGLTDLGQSGMAAFFRSHECNQYCQSNWLWPTSRDSIWDAESIPAREESTSWAPELRGVGGGAPRWAPPPTIHEYDEYDTDEYSY